MSAARQANRQALQAHHNHGTAVDSKPWRDTGLERPDLGSLQEAAKPQTPAPAIP
jgi:hypothetical protein